jgi:hypothetical protein
LRSFFPSPVFPPVRASSFARVLMEFPLLAAVALVHVLASHSILTLSFIFMPYFHRASFREAIAARVALGRTSKLL